MCLCVVSTVFWIFWVVGARLLWARHETIKKVALRKLPTSMYRLDGWFLVLYHNWEIDDPVDVLKNVSSGYLNHQLLKWATKDTPTTHHGTALGNSRVFWV